MRMTDLKNPYFETVAGGVTVGANRVDWSPDHVDLLRRREELVEKYAWGIPNEAAIKRIAEYEPILEVGAGSGYWAHLLRQLDVDVLATDLEAPVEPQWSPVWRADAQSVVPDYPDRTLLLVWPSYGETWAAEALGAYQGDTCIYVGEGRGGCTADDRFHQMLHEEWSLAETVAIPQYLCLHDRLEVWLDDD
jgi:hypothetical protein